MNLDEEKQRKFEQIAGLITAFWIKNKNIESIPPHITKAIFEIYNTIFDEKEFDDSAVSRDKVWNNLFEYYQTNRHNYGV